MRKALLAISLFGCLSFPFTVFSQPFTLVRDINPGPDLDPDRPSDLTEVGGLVFFKINNGAKAGIWKTDGTPEGTVAVVSLSPYEKIESLVNAKGTLFYVVTSTVPYTTSTNSLWKSDGTIGGSVLLHSWSGKRINYQTAVNNDLYFTFANTWQAPAELWKSDGTTAGTTMLKTASYIENLANVNGTLFFSAAEDAVPYHRLYKSDGTVTGTVMVKDIAAGSGNAYLYKFFNANGTLYFGGSDGVSGALWKSDGTEAGTLMVKDIEVGTTGNIVSRFAMANGSLYFFATSAINGNGLWKSDGTPGGTQLIKSFSNFGDLVSVNDALFFSAYDDINGNGLWKSDGKEEGTVLVKRVAAGFLSNSNGVLYFTSGDAEIWKSDGTAAGTVLLKGGYQQRLVTIPIQFVFANGITYFSASEPETGWELWKTDGTTDGTVLVKHLVPSPDGSPQDFIAAHGVVYFSVLSYVNSPGPALGRSVFQTDGTSTGTVRAERINSRTHSFPIDMIKHNGELYISGTSSHSNNFSGYELWKISAKGANAVRVKNINTSPNGIGSEPYNFQSVGQFLYFSANDDTTGFELWKSDGTEQGTVLVKDINPAGNSNPANLVNVNGVLYFTANNGTDGIELWKSDGTDAGTVLVKNVNTTSNSNPSFLTNVNGTLYFTADDGVNGVELWKSNGTGTGTILVKNMNASGNSSNPSFLTNVNGALYFAADDGVNGVEVWKSNGTEAGTVLVKDIYSGPVSSNPGLFTNLNGIVLFAADDGVAGRELWGSNGTNAGTILVKDIQIGAFASNPTALKRVGPNILFAADDGVHGNEVWLSNGAELGTRLMSEIQPGVSGSNPTEIFEYGSKVLVAATHELYGSEVWIADVPADVPTLIATITAEGPVAVCTGKSVTLKANTGTGYTYQWKKAGVNIAGANQSNYTATLGGYYSVVVKDAFGFSAISETVIVTVVNPPLATVAAAGPLSFCLGKNVLLKAITGTGYTYQWKKAGVIIDNATSSNYTAATAGAYSVVVTNATGCSATSALINVAVNLVPLATVAAASALTFCEGKTVQLKAITGTGYTYQWKRGAADIVGATSSTFNASTTGIYTVIVTNAGGCSAVSAGLTVVVKPLPAATITAVGPATFCSGKNVLLRANTGTNYTYQWIRGAAPVPGAVQSNFSATEPGLYTVIVTNASGCSVTSSAIAVSVNPLPVATITPVGSLTFCAGQSVLLRANTGTNYTYQWRKAGANITGATQANYTAIASGAYSVVVTNAAGCAVTSAAVTVTVNNAPLASVAAAGPTTFCSGKNVLLKAITGAGYIYQWKKNNVNIAGETTSNYTATTAGYYSVVVSNASGCSTTSSLITVATTPAPLASVAATSPLTFCEGRNVLLKAIVGAGYTYQWKKNGVNIPAQTQSNFTASATGVYTVLVTNVEGCTTLSGVINITVTPAPAAIINTSGPLTFPQGGSVTLNVPAAAGNTYQWKKDGVNISGATTESYTATVGGSYIVAVTNATRCQAISQPSVVTVTQSRPITKGLQEEESINVYPNPLYRNDYVNIDWSIIDADKGVVVNVFDMTGRRINSQVLKPGDGTVKVKGASGVYLVELRWGVNKRKVFRVVKIE